MPTTLVFNGTPRTFPDDFTGTGYAAIWEQFWSDIGADLRFFQGLGATSTSSVSVGTGAKSFTLAAAVNLPAGTYKIASAASPANYMVATLASALVAGTALNVTSQIAAGSGTFADWIVAPLWDVRRRPVLAKTGAYTVAAADDQALIDVTANSPAITLPSAASAGSGFRVGIRNSQAAGRVTVSGTVDGAANPSVGPGECWELISDGAAWKTTAKTNPLTRARVLAAALSIQ